MLRLLSKQLAVTHEIKIYTETLNCSLPLLNTYPCLMMDVLMTLKSLKKVTLRYLYCHHNGDEQHVFVLWKHISVFRIVRKCFKSTWSLFQPLINFQQDCWFNPVRTVHRARRKFLTPIAKLKNFINNVITAQNHSYFNLGLQNKSLVRITYERHMLTESVLKNEQ